MRSNLITTIAAALIALAALLTAPAHAQVLSSQGYYQTATSGGCTAVFFSLTTYDARIASASGSFTDWTKITDTCGLAPSSQADFADMGYCTAGPVSDSAWCSVSGAVIRSWTVFPNCSRQLVSVTDGAVYSGNPAAACVGAVNTN